MTSHPVDRVDVAANLADVEQRITTACQAAGRSRDEVHLLPVTKTHPVELVDQAIAAGHRRFGENRVQELVGKAQHYQEHPPPGGPVEWVVIGHLQSNKAKDAAQWATELQSLDSLRLAEQLQRRLDALDRSLDVLVQVNSSGEHTKSGLAPDEVLDFARALAPFDRLRVRGLMTLALPGPDQQAVAACFVRMQHLQRELRDAQVLGSTWDELSMGMSGDLDLAIAHGATIVRVGTAIFGERARLD
ncbi:YggS family pyridoxal phosphate-dependent enzyme [Aestuariimicrobium ganziense]|uniref:YggS family pyridoxal phosphate-dependent enzyme n=1 Tax=Aestuariimicrobium ganziense TaxID=2773677 RepID=UPI00194564BA|nr:YggS family pyridoxal phosphate-dependent enzyme [Aestuariimicrobium ganziense]